MKRLLIVLAVVTACQTQPSQDYSTIEPATGAIGSSAMVSSAHPLATKVGVDILKNGGNAYDAAIAVHFALAVVYPQAGNIGGGGFAVVRNKDGEIAALDFREKAPNAAHRDMYLDDQGNVVKDLSTLGHLAVGVPGSVAGMWELHQKYGTLPWESLVQPSILLAYNGYKLTKRAAGILNYTKEGFLSANDYVPWTVHQEEWQEGELIVARDLATTLSFIRDQGRDGFYKGIVADQISKDMIRNRGIITQADLDDYFPVWRDPIVSTYKNHKIIGMPPSSSGGVAIAQLLYGAEKLNLGSLEYHSPEYINLMVEIEKRVFADRSQFLGDTDFYDVPLSSLVSADYLNDRFEGIDKSKITPSKEISHGKVIRESEQTTHYSIVDSEGNAIAVTTTLNGSMGSRVVVKGAGIILNNEMDDFSSKPGVPNMFGLIGSEANSIAPGKRMLSSMTPTIVEKDGKLKMVLGTPGGATIITCVFQVILNVIDHDMTMQEAVNAPKIHHQWLPDSTQLEKGRFPEGLIDALEDLGHGIKYRSQTGRMDCILVVNDSTLEGASDYTRGDNYSEGY